MRRRLLCLTVVVCLGCIGDATSPPPNPALSIRFTAVSAGATHSCALDDQGRAWCWGFNDFGQLGVPIASCLLFGTSTECPGLATPISGTLRFTAITTGSYFSCGLRVDGQAFCWGGDDADQLGVTSKPASVCHSDPCSTDPLGVSGGLTFAQIASGGSSTCGVTTSGVGKCWGEGFPLNGQSTVIRSATPLSVTSTSGDSTWDAISGAGAFEDCGVTAAHQALCWGDNTYGQLGTGTVGSSLGPAVVATPTPLHGLVIGSGFVCGLDSGGTAYCWGHSSDGVLGNGTVSGTTQCAFSQIVACVPVPTKVGGDHQFSSLSAGEFHVCGVATATGDGYCWGTNVSGALGSGTLSTSSNPVTTPALVAGGLHFKAISAGADFTCGVTTEGALYCWGDNFQGQLGVQVGPIFFAYAPIRVVPVIPP